MKGLIKKALQFFGYDILKLNPFPPGAAQRPVGDMKKLLEDMKVRGLNCKSIMDVGANVSDWSRMAKEVFHDARYCLIEPQVEMEPYLKAFCQISKGSVYFLAGAGKRVEEKALTVWDDMAGSSFLPPENDDLKISGKQRVINMISIDSIIEDKLFDVPEIVKLDVQGYELEALKGAEKIFGKTEVFILEVSLFAFSDVPGIPLFADVIKFMNDRDYVVYDFPGFSRRPLDGALAQCDVCFVKKNSFLRASNDWS